LERLGGSTSESISGVSGVRGSGTHRTAGRRLPRVDRLGGSNETAKPGGDRRARRSLLRLGSAQVRARSSDRIGRRKHKRRYFFGGTDRRTAPQLLHDPRSRRWRAMSPPQANPEGAPTVSSNSWLQHWPRKNQRRDTLENALSPRDASAGLKKSATRHPTTSPSRGSRVKRFNLFFFFFAGWEALWRGGT